MAYECQYNHGFNGADILVNSVSKIDSASVAIGGDASIKKNRLFLNLVTDLIVQEEMVQYLYIQYFLRLDKGINFNNQAYLYLPSSKFNNNPNWSLRKPETWVIPVLDFSYPSFISTAPIENFWLTISLHNANSAIKPVRSKIKINYHVDLESDDPLGSFLFLFFEQPGM